MGLVNLGGLKDAKALDFTPVPPGKYGVAVALTELTKSKQKKLPMLKLKLRIVDPPEHKGRQVFTQIVLPNTDSTQEANEMSMGKLAALYDALEVARPESVPEDEAGLAQMFRDDLTGKTAVATINKRTNPENGKEVNEVDSFQKA